MFSGVTSNEDAERGLKSEEHLGGCFSHDRENSRGDDRDQVSGHLSTSASLDDLKRGRRLGDDRQRRHLRALAPLSRLPLDSVHQVR